MLITLQRFKFHFQFPFPQPFSNQSKTTITILTWQSKPISRNHIQHLPSINHKHRTHAKSKFNNYPTKKRQKKKWGEFPHLPKCSIFLIINTHFLLKQAREPTAKQEQNKANNNPKFRSNHLMRDHQQSWRTKTELQH